MLRSTKEVFGYRLTAADGEIGSVHDMSFDDRAATIRYIVADSGGWLFGQLVLLSPVCFSSPDWRARTIPVSLTKEQIENSPSIDADKTVSRQHESELHKYYGWPAYWTASPPPGEIGYIPNMPVVEPANGEEGAESRSDPHLRSVKEVMGYHIQATDGEIGHVEDFVFDDKSWIIRYMVVDTRNWLPGRKVLVSPAWISTIRWDERKVYVDMVRESVQNAPEYDPSQPVNREYEARLYDYYGRPKYW